MGLLEDLATRLETAGIASLGTTLFLGWMPDSPDGVLSLHETAGFAPLYTHNAPSPAIERPGLQVLARDATYTDARARIQAAYDVLAALTDYLAIRPVQMPFAIGRDERNRPMFSVNFALSVTT